MSLLHAEWRRLFKRRFTVWSLAAVVVVLALAAVVIFFSYEKHTPAAIAAAEAEVALDLEQQQEWIERDIEQCERDKETGDDTGWPEHCAEMRAWVPTREEMLEWYLPPTYEFREEFPGGIMIMIGLLAMYAYLVGASFIGAEWRSGGMMNLLLWRPRRLQVFGAKFAGLALGLTVIFTVLAALWTGAMWLVAVARGVTDTTTSGVWQSIGLTWLRGLALVLVAGLVGFALASIGRHVAAALGSAVAAGLVGIAGVGIVVSVLGVKFPESWLWPTYVTAWINKVMVLQYWGSCTGTGPCEPEILEITWQDAGGLMAALAVLVAGAAMWQLRARDIA